MRKWDDGRPWEAASCRISRPSVQPRWTSSSNLEVTLGSNLALADGCHDHGEVWPPAKGTSATHSRRWSRRKPISTPRSTASIGYQGHVPARARQGRQLPARACAWPTGAHAAGVIGASSSQASRSRAVVACRASPALPTNPFAAPRMLRLSSSSASPGLWLAPSPALLLFYPPLTSPRSAHPRVLCPAASEPPLYMSEARDPQLAAQFKPGQRIHASMDPNDTYKGGVPPATRAMHGSRYQIGQSVFSTADTYGHRLAGATAKQFSSPMTRAAQTSRRCPASTRAASLLTACRTTPATALFWMMESRATRGRSRWGPRRTSTTSTARPVAASILAFAGGGRL